MDIDDTIEYDDWDKKMNEKRLAKRIGSIVPAVRFKIRVRDDSIQGPNPFRWDEINTYQMFAGKKVIVFSLPGAFTPTCDTYQLPGFENNYDKFKELGIDDIYCVSVNDSFVMNCWAKQQNLKNVKVVPDGNADFTTSMRMSVEKRNLGFGSRSWRYAFIAEDGIIKAWWQEPGFANDAEDDPYGETSPENILQYLQALERMSMFCGINRQ
jgi:thioredoxin-dependent peroxiredoxin